MIEEIPVAKSSIHIGDQEIIIDNTRLSFNEITLSSFMENLGLWYDYFSQKLAEAEALLAYKEYEYEIYFSAAYEKFKEEGNTDKLADASARKDPDVSSCKKEIISAKHKVTLLKQHLRSWDKAHENAQSRGHMIRKEMEKLNTDISIKRSITDEVDSIVRKLK
jgi:chromosome segregation ATPase